MKQTSTKNSAGFSIIELMVVIAIIGILASIAIPNYRSHIIRVGYVETMSELQLLMTTMEDYYLANNLSYSGNLNTVTGITGTIKTSSGDYTITASQCSDGNGGTRGFSECVKLTATSTTDTFTIDTDGYKTFNNTTGWPE